MSAVELDPAPRTPTGLCGTCAGDPAVHVDSGPCSGCPTCNGSGVCDWCDDCGAEPNMECDPGCSAWWA